MIHVTDSILTLMFIMKSMIHYYIAGMRGQPNWLRHINRFLHILIWIKEYYKNGKLMFEAEYLNDMRNGRIKEYYKNGKLLFGRWIYRR